jgi:hypothetical protein
MDALLVRVTIWAALFAYTAGELGRARTPRAPWARGVWTAGALLYAVHVAAAFTFVYQWSHATAYAHTARQTADYFGVDSGSGIWVNYAFTVLWLAEAIWWWAAPSRYLGRSRRVEFVVRGVFLFMIVNGAYVFVAGPMKWIGVAIVAALCAIWGVLPVRRASGAARRDPS